VHEKTFSLQKYSNFPVRRSKDLFANVPVKMPAFSSRPSRFFFQKKLQKVWREK